MDKFKDECGVFGIFGHPEAANMTYLGLYALQHRGQESAGIASSDGTRLHVSRSMGYVNDSFDEAVLSRLHGQMAVGHVRYSTAGSSRVATGSPCSASRRDARSARLVLSGAPLCRSTTSAQEIASVTIVGSFETSAPATLPTR